MNFTIGLSAPLGQQEPLVPGTKLCILTGSFGTEQWMFFATKNRTPVGVTMTIASSVNAGPIEFDYPSLFDHTSMLFGFSYLEDANEQQQWLTDMIDLPSTPLSSITKTDCENGDVQFSWNLSKNPVGFKFECPFGKTLLPKIAPETLPTTLFTIGAIELMPLPQNGEIIFNGVIVPTLAQWCPMEHTDDLSTRLETARLPQGFPIDSNCRYVVRTEQYHTMKHVPFLRNVEWLGTTDCSRTQTDKEGCGVDDTFLIQLWFNCHTCGIVGSNGVCAVCAFNCHKGHRVTLRGIDAFYCDCKDAEGRCTK